MFLFGCNNQSAKKTIILPLENNEGWWGGSIVYGELMPFNAASEFHNNLFADKSGNQSQPLLISSSGRFIWSEKPFSYEFIKNRLIIGDNHGKIIQAKKGNTLREVYLHVSKEYFPPDQQIPDPLLFTMPQYNTWIELNHFQNQEGILKYAGGILKNGFPPGVIMIDNTWQVAHGRWEFEKNRFPDPHSMMKKLHDLGFKVMLWVCPFISPDWYSWKELHKDTLLLRTERGEPALVNWWDGWSYVLDLSNPKSEKWLKRQLENLQQEYKVDGFKFDAGDAMYYNQGNPVSYGNISPNKQSELWAEIGLQYPLNEYRACWKLGGKRLVQRLRDKNCDWNDLQKLIPHILAQGLMGYAYTCPDMIGGGELSSFTDLNNINQQLLVRSSQASALMPMMQFSVAPWRVLDERHLDICRKMAILHKKFGKHILELSLNASKTGEPVVRSLEYMYPDQGYSRIKDQFLLGSEIMVAPVVKPDQNRRKVHIPPGIWRSEKNEKYIGPVVIETDTPLERLPFFQKIE